MKIQFTGMVCEITHAEDFDAITVQTGKRKSKIKAESGMFADELLLTDVEVTVESVKTLFDNVTGELNVKFGETIQKLMN